MNKMCHLFLAWIRFLIGFIKVKDPKIWVFGEWFGKKCGDNCTYFANFVSKKSSIVRVYWICEKNVDTSLLDKRITILEQGSEQANKILKKAGAIFLNQNFLDVSPYPYNCYGKAVSFNFWHGFPWKKIGHDGDKRNNLFFHFYCALLDPIQKARYYLSLSDIYSKKMKTAFGVKKECTVNGGYPRNTPFYSESEKKLYKNLIVQKIKEKICVSNEIDMKIIVYMPTFRDNGDKPVDLHLSFDEAFKDFLKTNNIYIVQKIHFADKNQDFLDEKQSSCIISLDHVPATVLMCAADVLISDYSSCIFDYLILNRPIIQFIYDYEKYRQKDRGLYFNINDIQCGLVAYNVDELKKNIKKSLEDNDQMRHLRLLRKKQFMGYENGDSSQQIYSWMCKKLGLE